MNLSKCFKIIISVLLCLVLFSGCTGNRHLKDLLIVEGLGIDLKDGTISVTLQSLNINMSNNPDSPDGNMTFNTSSSGKTVSYAVNSITKSVSKRAFFGHNKIIVLSKNLAENDINNYIDYFLRSEDARADVAICMSNSSADFILQSKEHNANVPCENILNLINNNEKTGQSILVDENELLMLYEDDTSDIYLPVVDRKDEKSAVHTCGIALFSNNRLSYITNDIETKGFVILQNKAKDVSLQINDEKLGTVDIKLSDIKCKKYASIVDNMPYFNVEVSADMILGEIEKGAQNSLGKDDYKRLSRLAQNACADAVKKCFAACVYAESDALRAGKYIARDCPDYYKKYMQDSKAEFKKIKLNSNASITLEKISDNSQLE